MVSSLQNIAEFIDIDTREDEDIERFVKLFYARLLEDEQLAPVFVDVAKVDNISLIKIRAIYKAPC